jgi:hypothetical protein
MEMRTASPQDTEMMIFGSGFSAYQHWGSLTPMFAHPVPDDWEWLVEYWEINDESWKVATVTHEIVMRSVQLIAKGDVLGTPGYTVMQCRLLMFDSEEADLDSNDVDVVLQLAIFGEIRY